MDDKVANDYFTGCTLAYSPLQPPPENIESSPVWDPSCVTELIYDLINRQLLCGKCPTPVTIKYLPASTPLIKQQRCCFTFFIVIYCHFRADYRLNYL